MQSLPLPLPSPLRGTRYVNASLSDYNTWRVGGTARCVYIPADLKDLCHFLKQQPPSEKICWIGLGSNLLIPDGKFEGTVIITQGALNQISVLDKTTVRFEAGVACGTAARFCARLGLTGLEFLAGIPGTIGGALALNAGAHGNETWEFVTQCETVDASANCYLRTPALFTIGYRYAKLITPPQQKEWFTAAHFRLVPGDKMQSLARIKALLTHRKITQPIEYPNCGSVFRNPSGDYAARLIEACGLKGLRRGGASISMKHANFIINDNHATANDIETLIRDIAEEVYTRFQIKLVREVHTLGES